MNFRNLRSQIIQGVYDELECHFQELWKRVYKGKVMIENDHHIQTKKLQFELILKNRIVNYIYQVVRKLKWLQFEFTVSLPP